MLTWLPIVLLVLTALATIICVRCSGNAQRTLETCNDVRMDTSYCKKQAEETLELCRKVFRERKNKLEDRGWTNLDLEEIARIELKVLQAMSDNDDNMHALKLAVIETLSEELKAL